MSTLNTFGQEKVLVIKNKTLEREKTIKKGERLQVTDKNDSVYLGKLDFIRNSDDSAIQKIVIGPDTLCLGDIKKINHKPLSSKITGYLLMGIGSGGIIFGLLCFTAIPGASEFGASLIRFYGTALSGGGFILSSVGLLIQSWDQYNADRFEYVIKLK